MNDYLSKPMAFQELRTKIHKWAGKKSPDGQIEFQILDPVAIESLKEYSVDGDDSLVQEIIAIFVETFPEDHRDMTAMLQKGQYHELSERAHRVKSTCAQLSIKPMVAICLYVEKNAVPENSVRLKEKLSELAKMYELAVSEFKKLPKAG